MMNPMRALPFRVPRPFRFASNRSVRNYIRMSVIRLFLPFRATDVFSNRIPGRCPGLDCSRPFRPGRRNANSWVVFPYPQIEIPEKGIADWLWRASNEPLQRPIDGIEHVVIEPCGP